MHLEELINSVSSGEFKDLLATVARFICSHYTSFEHCSRITSAFGVWGNKKESRRFQTLKCNKNSVVDHFCCLFPLSNIAQPILLKQNSTNRALSFRSVSKPLPRWGKWSTDVLNCSSAQKSILFTHFLNQKNCLIFTNWWKVILKRDRDAFYFPSFRAIRIHIYGNFCSFQRQTFIRL